MRPTWALRESLKRAVQIHSVSLRVSKGGVWSIGPAAGTDLGSWLANLSTLLAPLLFVLCFSVLAFSTPSWNTGLLSPS